MRPLVLPVYRRCNQACAFCAVADTLDGKPVPATELKAALDGARAAGHDGVCLTGGEATLAPSLIRALAYAHGLGLHTAISTNGRLLADVEKVKRLEATGLDAVHIALHAVDPAVHTALVGGDPVAHGQTLQALRHCAPRFDTTLRTVLTSTNLGEVPGLVALAAELGARFDLRCAARLGATPAALVPSPSQALAAWRTAWQACRDAGVPFTWWGFRAVTPAEATPHPPVTPDAAHLAQLEAGLLDDALLGGLSPGEDLHTAELVAVAGVGSALLPLALAARRTPRVSAGAVTSLPAEERLGPDDRVVVVVDEHTPPWLAASTLPALVQALQAGGAEARLASLYRGAFDARTPRAPAPTTVGRVAGLLRSRGPRPPEHPDLLDADTLAAGRELLDGALDAGTATVAVVGSRRSAAALRARPGLPAGLRLVVLDDEADAPLALQPRDVLRTPFPASAPRLVRAGVDLRRVRWRPTPLWVPHLPPLGHRDVVIVAGGGAVDADLLPAWPADRGWTLRAWPGTHAPGVEAAPRSVAGLLELLPRTRAVWLPVRGGPGLDPLLVSLAVALGLPLVTTPAGRPTDVLRPGRGRVVDATRVAHREALEGLDDATVARWTTPRPEAVSVQALADELLQGLPRPVVVPGADGLGPWWGWEA